MRKTLLLEIIYVVLILVAIFSVGFFQLLFILPGKIDTESIIFSLSLIAVFVLLALYAKKLRKQLKQSDDQQSKIINTDNNKAELAQIADEQTKMPKANATPKQVDNSSVGKKIRIATIVILLSLFGLGVTNFIDSKFGDEHMHKIGEYSRYEQEKKIDYATLEAQIQKLEKERNINGAIIGMANILLCFIIYLAIRTIFIARRQESQTNQEIANN